MQIKIEIYNKLYISIFISSCTLLLTVVGFIYLMHNKCGCKKKDKQNKHVTFAAGILGMNTTFSPALKNCLQNNQMDPSKCCSFMSSDDCDMLCNSGTGTGGCSQCPPC
jgi:hypothetical protein